MRTDQSQSSSKQQAKSRPKPQRVEQGVKQRGAEKMARIPVKIIPTTEMPRKPDWIRVKMPISPEVERIKIVT